MSKYYYDGFSPKYFYMPDPATRHYEKYLVGADIDGAYFALKEPVLYTEDNIIQLKILAHSIAAEDPECRAYRMRREALAEEHVEIDFYHAMVEDARVGWDYEDQSEALWKKLYPMVEREAYRKKRDAMIYAEYIETGCTKASLSRKWDISSSRISNILYVQDRKERYRKIKYDREFRDAVKDPDFPNSDYHGTIHEWNAEQQYQEIQEFIHEEI